MNHISHIKEIDIDKITKAMLLHNGQPFTTTKQISKYFSKKHADVMEKIRAFNSYDEMLRVGKIRPLNLQYRGQEYEAFELDADAFSFTCLSMTGKKAESFKWAFIEAFKKSTAKVISARASIKANEANQIWLEAREDGKSTRKALQNKIKEFCEYAQVQRGNTYPQCPYFKHITDAIYDYLSIKAPTGNKFPRDVYSGAIVESIESAEQDTIILLDEIMEAGKTRNAIKVQITDRLKRNALGHKS